MSTAQTNLPLPLTSTLAPWQEVRAPHGLGYRIRLMAQLMSRLFQEKLDPYGLTPFHWVVLCCLWQQDGQATSQIGEKLSQVGGTMTGVIDRMEERGLVRRERDGRDRRIWRIWLTDMGRQLEATLPPLALEVREAAFAGITEAEQKLISDAVDRAIANLAHP
ncbi:MarR family winged helix-turn-helix transcriptional regulator [Nodosilinea sp. AN01ver1]|uniref:MarR family winged helix-turn-helix transcriptional regulator n=1 Tax=Nodosilinea sp. AN01ver1 TaxID=3423362 RepID=UPI003D31E6B0